MEKIIKERVLEILEKILGAVKEKDVIALKLLSNQTIHNASIFQDDYSISTAVIAYSLSKIIERYRFNETKEWLKFHNDIVNDLSNARKELLGENIEVYKSILKNIFKIIEEFDHRLAIYIQQVIEKSKIKKGSVIFEHGISIARVAQLLGVSRWDLMSYVGKTNIFDIEKEALNVENRLNFTRKLFGINEKLGF